MSFPEMERKKLSHLCVKHNNTLPTNNNIYITVRRVILYTTNDKTSL